MLHWTQRLLQLTALCLLMALPCAAHSAESPPAVARAALLAALTEYEPGSTPTADITARIDAAAAALERTGPAPDLNARSEQLRGQWLTRFSSQGVFGDVDVSFMTRTLPGGGASGGKAHVEQVLQELQPAKGQYRNTLVLRVGPDNLPALYFATAELGISNARSNDLEVSFRRIEFVPARVDVTPAALRAALGLGAEVPLAIDLPAMPNRPPSLSTVTYLDDGLRINRGKDYIAVLEKLR